MEQNRIDEIATLGDQVASEHKDYEMAIDRELAAEAELLDAIITRIKPALPALGGRWKRAERCYSNDAGTHLWEETDWYDFRGVSVAGEGLEKTPEESAGRGSISGDRLVLITKQAGGYDPGDLVRIKYQGRWSRCRGDGDKWESQAHIVAAENALAEYGLDRIIKSLVEKLTKQVDGKKGKRAEQARARAERLSALAKLL